MRRKTRAYWFITYPIFKMNNKQKIKKRMIVRVKIFTMDVTEGIKISEDVS